MFDSAPGSINSKNWRSPLVRLDPSSFTDKMASSQAKYKKLLSDLDNIPTLSGQPISFVPISQTTSSKKLKQRAFQISVAPSNALPRSSSVNPAPLLHRSTSRLKITPKLNIGAETTRNGFNGSPTEGLRVTGNSALSSQKRFQNLRKMMKNSKTLKFVKPVSTANNANSYKFKLNVESRLLTKIISDS